MLKSIQYVAFSLISILLIQSAHTQQDNVQSTLEKLFDLNRTRYENIHTQSERLAASDNQVALLNGIAWTYRFYVNETYIDDPIGELPPASMVSFSYERVGYERNLKRPILFAYNGGPGSTSVWLHMGAWGPKRVAIPGGPEVPNDRPYDIVDNAGFLIDVADLVFVDPINTGLSAPVDTADTKAFKGLEPDARSHCLFIHNWLKANDRLGAPIYLAGESYGTMRIAMMQTHPACGKLKLNFDGLIMVSGLIDVESRGQTASSGIMNFPTAAAIAWYHKQVDHSLWNNDIEAYLDAARNFATTTFGPTLALGEYAAEETKHKVALQKAAFLGLQHEENTKLSNIWTFPLGPLCMYDARYICSADSGNKPISPFPPLKMDILGRVFTTALSEWTEEISGFDIGRQYKWRSNKASHSNWAMTVPKTKSGFLSGPLPKKLAYRQRQQFLAMDQYAETDATAAEQDQVSPPPPRTRIMVASGLHDIMTPFFGMEFPLKREGVIIDALHLYQGGHMMYFDEKVGRQLADDVRSFIQGTPT